MVRHPILKRIVGCTATSNFFSSAYVAVEAVFLVRVLHARPGVIGLVFSLAAVGGLVGGVFAGRIAQRIGSARAIWVSQVLAGPFALLAAFAFPGWGVVLVAVGGFASSLSGVVYNVGQVSYRQAICPPDLLGRMNASVRFIVWGTMPLGGLAGGILGTLIGVRATVLRGRPGDVGLGAVADLLAAVRHARRARGVGRGPHRHRRIGGVGGGARRSVGVRSERTDLTPRRPS